MRSHQNCNKRKIENFLWLRINDELQKMRYIFDIPKMPKIGKMREKKGQKSNQNVSHRYGKKIIL